jgi:hypothetical protein
MIDVEGYYPYFDNYYGALDHFNRENINLMNIYRVYTTDSYAEAKVHTDQDRYRMHALFLGRTSSNGGMYPLRVASVGAMQYYVSPAALIDVTAILFECSFTQLNNLQRGEKLSIGLLSNTPTSHTGSDDAFSSNAMIALRYDGGDDYYNAKSNYEIIYSNGNNSIVVDSNVPRDSNEHRFRIIWSSNRIEAYIDGVRRLDVNHNINRALLPAFSVRNARSSVALDVRLVIDYWHISYI